MTAERNSKTADGSASGQERRDDKAGRKTRRKAIGAELRQAYDDVVREPVPDSFRGILDGSPDQPGKRK